MNVGSEGGLSFKASKGKKATIEQGEDGMNRLTEAYLEALCEENEQYCTPHLNDQLFLHFKGFKKIECLEKYYNLRTLWLESNGLRQLSGIAHCTKLRMIFLQNNLLTKIEGIETCVDLVRINLSNNLLERVEGMTTLKKLQHLDISKNQIKLTSDMQELTELPELIGIDCASNLITDQENVVEFFTQMQTLITIQSKDNPFARHIKQIRRRLTNALPNLYYFDDRPITEIDRAAAKAWETGGLEAERAIR